MRTDIRLVVGENHATSPLQDLGPKTYTLRYGNYRLCFQLMFPLLLGFFFNMIKCTCCIKCDSPNVSNKG